jgi:hypothetical protein
VLREDAGFHAYQMPEAGVRHVDEALHIPIAVALYLAAHSPTERAALQTVNVTRRFIQGDFLH